MQGTTLTRLFCAIAVVIGLAVGAVAFLMPSSSKAGSDPAGPPLPGASGDARIRSGGDSAAWLIEENKKPGTRDWQIGGPINNGNIEGFAETTSAVQGDSVRLFVSTDAPGYVVEAYRMGFYGGSQGRLVWRSDRMPGSRQAPAVVDSTTRMTEAKWRPSLTVKLDATWPPGDYLIKLVAENGFQQYIPLAVRDDSSDAPLLVVNAVTTWQAYNTWGGHSLYEGRIRQGSFTGEQRANVVSFDRPYVNDSGAGDFLGNELPLVTLVESLGLDVSYITDVDLHQRPHLLAQHKALLTLGHDEYWTLEMRDAVEKARDSGMNLVFFGANAVYRAIRLAPSSLGPNRQQANYRSARTDPFSLTDKSRVTVSWREAPLNRPESSLVGTYYECNPVKADMVIADPTAWVFAGTGLESGDKLKNAVGPEYDRYFKNVPQPPGPVQVLAHSPVRCRGKASYSDMTYYSVPSGAGVFSTGTNWWISRLGPACPPDDCVDEKIVRITSNVLRVFAVGPAGREHPSTSNAGQLSDGLTSRSSTTVRPDDTEQQYSSTTTTRRSTTLPPTTVATTTTTPTPKTTVSFPSAPRSQSP